MSHPVLRANVSRRNIPFADLLVVAVAVAVEDTAADIASATATNAATMDNSATQVHRIFFIHLSVVIFSFVCVNLFDGRFPPHAGVRVSGRNTWCPATLAYSAAATAAVAAGPGGYPKHACSVHFSQRCCHVAIVGAPGSRGASQS